MDKEEKLTFLKKLKFSIFDFEKYQNLALEKISRTIGYIALLVLVFSLIVSGIMTFKVYSISQNIREYIDENIETIDDPWNSVISRAKEYHGIRIPGHKKTKSVYQKLIPEVCRNWDIVKMRCSQAAFFEQNVLSLQ